MSGIKQMQNNQYKKILGVMMLVSVFFFVSGFGTPAHAGDGPGLVDLAFGAASVITAGIMDGISWFFGAITIVLTAIAKLLFQLAGFLITFGLQLNASVMANPVVLTGWVIARNLSNLAIVFGLIMIAFATILRIDSWGAKKLLGDLIIVALLINFSLLIPGIFIDASGVVTNFFAQKVTGADIGKVAEVIASATSIASLEKASYADLLLRSGTVKAEAAATQFSQGTIDTIVQMFFMALFTYFAAIVLGNVAYIIFYRFFTLLALLVMAPLASTAYIFPKTKEYFSQWWKSLIQQSISLPVIMFFIYLAVATAVGTEKASNDYFGEMAKIVANDFGSFKNLFTQVGKMITILGLLKVGLVAGEKLGEKGASAGLGMMKSAQTFAMGALAGGAGATAGWLPRKIFAGGKIEKDGVVSTRGERLSGALSRIGMVGVAGGIDKLSTRGPEQISAYQKQYANMSDAMFMGVANSGILGRLSATEGDLEAAARIQELSKRKGVLKELGKTENGKKILQNLIGRSKAFGVHKEIYKVRPDLGGLEDKKRFVANLSPKGIEDIDSDLLLDADINAGLEKRHIEAIAQNSGDKQDKFLKGMEARIDSVDKLGDRKDDGAEWLRQNLDEDLNNVFQNSVLQHRLSGLKLEKLNAKLKESKKPRPAEKEAQTAPTKLPPSAPPPPPAPESHPTPATPPAPTTNSVPQKKDSADERAENIRKTQNALKKQTDEMRDLQEQIRNGKLSDGAKKDAEKKLKEVENVVNNLKESLEKFS